MSYTEDFYYSPEKFGLELVGELEDPQAHYSFDLLVVYIRKEDGALLWGTDSGCSCPGVFEDMKVEDLSVIDSWDTLREFVQVALRRRGTNHVVDGVSIHDAFGGELFWPDGPQLAAKVSKLYRESRG